MAESTDSQDHVIVVGIDGSDPSKDALGWAVLQAELTGACLRVVMTWQTPSFAYGPAALLPADINFADPSRDVLDKMLFEVLGEHPAVKVSSVVTEGAPAEKLLEAAGGADLLVVGSRGHGAFAGMLLGSVSQHCATHASCPVVVVRHDAHTA